MHANDVGVKEHGVIGTFCKIAILLSIILFSSASEAGAACPGSADLIRTAIFTLPKGGSSQSAQIVGSALGTTYYEGGFSGLDRIDADSFWTVSDRGPNLGVSAIGCGKQFPVPTFAPTIYKIATTGASVSILQRIPLHLPSGFDDPAQLNLGAVPGSLQANLVTGLPNFGQGMAIPNAVAWSGVPSADEVGCDPAGAVLKDDPYGLDTEDVVAAPDRTFWISDEYRASIIHVSSSGEILSRLVPAGENLLGSAYPILGVLPGEYRYRTANKGIEGLTISADGNTLYGALQAALIGESGANTRLFTIDVSTPSSPSFKREFAYPLSNSGVSGLEWVGPGDLVAVDDRNGSVNSPGKHVYTVDLSGTGGAIGSLTDPPALAKSLFVQFSTAVTTLGSPAGNYPYEKLEGLDIQIDGFGKRTINVANDNDFGADSSTIYRFTATPCASVVAVPVGAPLPLFVGSIGVVVFLIKRRRAPSGVTNSGSRRIRS
jgi:Esterase-like activity of phytase